MVERARGSVYRMKKTKHVLYPFRDVYSVLRKVDIGTKCVMTSKVYEWKSVQLCNTAKVVGRLC